MAVSKAMSAGPVYLSDDGPLKAAVTAGDYTHAGCMIQPYPGKWTTPEGGLFIYVSFSPSPHPSRAARAWLFIPGKHPGRQGRAQTSQFHNNVTILF
jgi:hypothetical protein